MEQLAISTVCSPYFEDVLVHVQNDELMKNQDRLRVAQMAAEEFAKARYNKEELDEYGVIKKAQQIRAVLDASLTKLGEGVSLRMISEDPEPEWVGDNKEETAKNKKAEDYYTVFVPRVAEAYLHLAKALFKGANFEEGLNLAREYENRAKTLIDAHTSFLIELQRKKPFYSRSWNFFWRLSVLRVEVLAMFGEERQLQVLQEQEWGNPAADADFRLAIAAGKVERAKQSFKNIRAEVSQFAQEDLNELMSGFDSRQQERLMELTSSF